MRVMLVDDEPAMLLAMKMLLAKMEGVQLVGAFHQGQEALACVAEQAVQLAFLDIELAGESGLALARSLRALDPKLAIVFTTSHTEFAMQAYDVYPLDYMVKPISRIRLEQTISRAVAASGAGPVQLPAPEENANLRVRGFGCFEASSLCGGEVKWISRKSKELFAYLIMHHGRTVSKMRIIEDLFSEASFKNAETYLYTAVYQLRKVLDMHGEKRRVVTAHEKYRIDLDGAEIDFIAFEHSLEAFSVIGEDQLDAALEVERQFLGELFEGIHQDWAGAERERINLLYDEFVKRLADSLLAHGRIREAAHIAKRLTTRNPYDEEARVILMKSYHALGDLAGIMACYRTYTKLLQEELGVKPSAVFEQQYLTYFQ